MPLDAGPVSDLLASSGSARGVALLRPRVVSLQAEGDVGSALRSARESLGLSVEDIAQATRIRPAQVAALEAFDLASLPSRPFVIGFVRAYALALGLETEAVVARFRAEAPAPDDRLRAPPSLRDQLQGRRYGLAAAVGLMLLAAVVGWNIVRHAAVTPRRAPAPASHPIASTGAPVAAQLGAPLPAPPEASAPPTYETPGLATAPPAPGDPAGAAFVATGPIFGAPAAQSHITLQARKSTSLVVRGPGGAIAFARQLAAGEAWRAPDAAGLEVDVGNPASVEAFVNGVSTGDLVTEKTPLASLLQTPGGR